MQLSDIKYAGPKLDKATRMSTYNLIDHTMHQAKLWTGSFRQCWIRRAYLAQHEDINHFEIILADRNDQKKGE